MANIRMRRFHGLDREAARKAAGAVAERLQNELGLRYQWHGDRLEFSRAGAHGHVAVDDSEVSVEVTLGWILAPMRASIEKQIGDYLDCHFGPEASPSLG
jgi:putative polyhydroxyalkanoate system protein